MRAGLPKLIIERIPEWLLGKADDREIAELLSRSFSTDFGGRSYFRTRQHLRFVHRSGGRIVAHMALQFRAMRLGGVLITVAGLADVATDEAHRGQGIAGQMLHAVIANAKASPADFLLLFGTARLYHAAGCHTFHNPMIWVELRDAVTGGVYREIAEELMVLSLRGAAWDDHAELDLLGSLF